MGNCFSSPQLIKRKSCSHSPTLEIMDNTSGSKRVKMIVTKQQLQELLSEKVSVEEIWLLGMQNVALCGVNSSSRWQPGLETILEETQKVVICEKSYKKSFVCAFSTPITGHKGHLCLELKERASRSEPSLFKKFQNFQYLLRFNHVLVSAVQTIIR